MSSTHQTQGQSTGTGNATDDPDLTFWEQSQTSAWQRYMTDAQREAVLRTHAAASRPGLLIDFGCGPGRWTNLLMKHGWKAICIDKDPYILGRCQKANPTAQCIEWSTERHRLPVEDGTVQLVLCIGVYHVLESDWFLPEVRRVLEPGGLLSGAFFNRCSGRGLYRFTLDHLFGGQKSYHQSYGSWRRRARRQGFDMVEDSGLCWFPLPCFSDSPLVSLCTRLEKVCGLQQLPSLSPWVNFLARKRPA